MDKRKIVSIVLFTTLMMSVSLTLNSEQTEPKDDVSHVALAKEYIHSLTLKDSTLQRSFYNEASVFVDPTSKAFGEEWNYVGGKQIADFFDKMNGEFKSVEIKNEVLDVLYNSPFVVLKIRSTVTNCADMFDRPNMALTSYIDVVVILEFDGSKIAKRTDYAEYDRAWEVANARASDQNNFFLHEECSA